MPQSAENRYLRILERIFLSRYATGAREVEFERDDIVRAAEELKLEPPKNLGDVVYSFRYRQDFPKSIASRAPQGENWIILPAGKSRYRFAATPLSTIVPALGIAETKVPDATPGLISMYALTDEQALLAKLRYNRLIDIFTGLTCYSLQSHLRTAVPSMGQVETDEIYVGIDKRGAHYVIPVQAKGGADRLSIVQVEQDCEVGAVKFPALICRPIAAQFMGNDLIALFLFERSGPTLAISSEKHFRLVPPEQMSAEDLDAYRRRAE